MRDVFAENVPIYVSAVTELELFAYSDLSAEEESLIDDSEVLEKKLRRFDHRRQVFGQPISFAGRNQNGHGHLGQRAHDARPTDFVDLRFVKELDESGFVKMLYKQR